LHRFVTTAILVVLGAVGFEVARRQIVGEYEAEGPAPPHEGAAMPWRKPASATAPTQVEELERLAKLRSDGLLTEDEYMAAKGRVLPPAAT
jgi:hypothetical protein